MCNFFKFKTKYIFAGLRFIKQFANKKEPLLIVSKSKQQANSLLP